jgi:hypothetical protein
MPSHALRLARWLVVAALLSGALPACDGDAGVASSAETLVSACKAGCTARHEGCPTTDTALCDFGCTALANLRADCRDLLVAQSDCEAQSAWKCLDTSEFVAVPVDAEACAAESAAFTEACPFGE